MEICKPNFALRTLKINNYVSNYDLVSPHGEDQAQIGCIYNNKTIDKIVSPENYLTFYLPCITRSITRNSNGFCSMILFFVVNIEHCCE